MATQRLTRIYQLQVQADQYNREMKKMAASTQAIEKQLGGMQRAFKLVAKASVAVYATQRVAGFVTGMVKAADSVILLESSFGQLLKSGRRGEDMLERVYEIAERTGAPLESVGKSVQQLTVGLGAMGASNEEIAQIAENFLKLGRIGGKQIEDVNGALYQFSQALASNRLQGDEFRAILERVPLVAQKIADYLDVDIGKLKDLAKQGVITADVMRASLLSSTDEINESFGALPAIFEQGTARLGSRFVNWLQSYRKQPTPARTLAEGMSAFAKYIRIAAGGVGDFVAKIKSIITGFSDLFKAYYETNKALLDYTALMGGAAVAVSLVTESVHERDPGYQRL